MTTIPADHGPIPWHRAIIENVQPRVDGGRFDEICEVWDVRDRLVAQATQLAAIRIPEGLRPPEVRETRSY